MYDELAEWWPLLSPPEEYREAAAFYAQTLIDACETPPYSLLELGSGGGNNASHMKSRFAMSLVDRSPEMLAVSRRLNPECEHIEGDMRTIRLDRQFDCVFVHDAISYMATEEDLGLAMLTAWLHCRPGGAVLLAPDHVTENFREATDAGGSDGPDRAMRYLEWTRDPDPSDGTFLVDYAYLLRHSDGSVTVEHDRHLEGLFASAVWLRLLASTGFTPTAIPFDAGLEGRGGMIFVGQRPLEAAGGRTLESESASDYNEGGDEVGGSA